MIPASKDSCRSNLLKRRHDRSRCHGGEAQQWYEQKMRPEREPSRGSHFALPHVAVLGCKGEVFQSYPVSTDHAASDGDDASVDRILLGSSQTNVKRQTSNAYHTTQRIITIVREAGIIDTQQTRSNTSQLEL